MSIRNGVRHWRTQRGRGQGVQTPPHWIFKKLYCVFAKYTLQALLLCSLDPKFYTGKRWKLYANFTFCFSFWGISSPDPLPGLCPWTPLGDFHPPDLLARSPTTWTPYCKILGTLMVLEKVCAKQRLLPVCHYFYNWLLLSNFAALNVYTVFVERLCAKVSYKHTYICIYICCLLIFLCNILCCGFYCE